MTRYHIFYNWQLFFEKAILLFLLPCLAATAFAQTDNSNDVQKSFDQYQSSTLQEKLFVHTDKSFYVAGEIVWCKVYNVDASTHQPTDISKVSYIEIINKENKPVLQAKISMQNGTGNGSFLLPFSMASGNYILRAYTNWMKNFNPEFFFEKQMTIVNTLKNSESQTDVDTTAYDIQFFPEGGNLVNRLESNVAFKVVNQYGQGTSFLGFLLNGKNDTLLRFQPLKFGMGRFSFTPKKEETYQAVIKVNDRLITKPLPSRYEQGYVMKLMSADNQHLSVSVTTNIRSSESPVYLFVHSGDKTVMAQTKPMTDGKAEFVLDKNTLPEGISHITLFNNAHQPLCERLYCKPPKRQLAIDVTTDATVQNTRHKIQLRIDTKDSARPIDANLSLSVFRLDSLQAPEATNLFNYLWLGSEIKGTIESPDYYLNDSSEEAREALDNLMLTQGWRRFQWNALLQNTKPFFHFLPEYEGQIITGKITNGTTGLPASGVATYFSVPGEKFAFGNAASDDSGNISWTVASRFYGSGEAIAQTGDTTANQYRIILTDPFSTQPFASSLLPFHLSEIWKESLLNNSINAQAQNAYLADERQRFIIPEIDTSAFYGKPDKRYLLDDYTRFPTMEEVMREFVTEVRVNKGGEQYHYTVDNLPYRVFFKGEPLVLLDGVPVWDVNKIIAFNPLLVKGLDVVTHKYYLGSQIYNGIVSYSTYKGDATGLELNPDAVQTEYEGLQLEREFYTPVYETPQQTGSRIPDFRNVLYWSPDVNTDSQGKATVTFYTSDLPGNYAVTLQGNTVKGLAGSRTITIAVKK